MKILKKWLVLILFVSWVFWPWLIGSVDVIAWVVAGTQVSTIPWELDGRSLAAGIWPVAWLAIVGVTMGSASLMK